MHIYLSPIFHPRSHAVRHFFEGQKWHPRRSRDSSCACSRSIEEQGEMWRENWTGKISDSLKAGAVKRSSPAETAIRAANSVYQNMINHNNHLQSSFMYLWNRLVYFHDMPHMEISDVIVQRKRGFRPKIQTRRVYGREVKRLVFSDALAPKTGDGIGGWMTPKGNIVPTNRCLLVSKLVQIMFWYFFDEKNKRFAGRVLKRIHESNHPQKESILVDSGVKYDAENLVYDPDNEDQYFFSPMNRDMIPSKPRFDNTQSGSKDEVKIRSVESLDPDQLEAAYQCLLDIIHEDQEEKEEAAEDAA